MSYLQALIDFGKGNYLECLKQLKFIVHSNPRCPPQIRFGIGLCYYRMGNINKAKIAFKRVLSFDLDHSMANIALAIIEL